MTEIIWEITKDFNYCHMFKNDRFVGTLKYNGEKFVTESIMSGLDFKELVDIGEICSMCDCYRKQWAILKVKVEALPHERFADEGKLYKYDGRFYQIRDGKWQQLWQMR